LQARAVDIRSSFQHILCNTSVYGALRFDDPGKTYQPTNPQNGSQKQEQAAPDLLTSMFEHGCEQAPLRGRQAKSLRLCRRIVTSAALPGVPALTLYKTLRIRLASVAFVALLCGLRKCVGKVALFQIRQRSLTSNAMP